MASRRKKYGWLYHEEEKVWMPPDGAYAAERLPSAWWVVWRNLSPYNMTGAEAVKDDCASLREAVDAASKDMGGSDA